jgi:hypothetical protein
MKQLYNFLLQPYTNVFYCVAYHYRWNSVSFPQSMVLAVKDAWRTSNHDYLYGNER